MNPIAIRYSLSTALILSAALLTACEGDSRPFEESVEVQTLGLTAIQVNPPEDSQPEIFINSGQSIQLALSGNGTAGPIENIPVSGRLWQSSNPSVFTVSENGLLTGVGELQGSAEASVLIGGIQSSSLTVTVNDATLESIRSIEGNDSLERCLPSEYFATGLFDDSTLRTLTNTGFTLNEGANATLSSASGRTTMINATTVGTLTLTATSGDAPPFPLQINVLDTLQSIAVSTANNAALEVNENETLDFTATGTYVNASQMTGDLGQTPPAAPGGSATGTRSVDITDNVDWAVTLNTSSASVINSGENRGRLSGLAVGTVTLQASCGTDTQESVQVSVKEDADSNSDQLAFAGAGTGNTLTVALGSQLQLEVSRGSVYDSAREVTIADDNLVFSVPSTQVNFVDQGALGNGLVIPQPQSAGATLNVTATITDDGTEISGTVTINIQ
ncbi:MAG: hypothetical protein AB8B64_20025 [Granulosicoccus sp.]